MSPQRIRKLNGELTSKEKALLVFSLLTQGNEREAEQVEASVACHLYRDLDAEYRAWWERCLRFASLWAMHYWQCRAQAMTATVATHLSFNDGKLEQGQQMLDQALLWEARLVALYDALRGICTEHRMSFEAVLAFAGAEDRPSTFTTPDTGRVRHHVEEYWTTLMPCLRAPSSIQL